jgi:hypothetical protein
MTLADLHDQLAPSFPAYARKDLQTAVRVLARALHCPTPQDCPLETFHQSIPILLRRVEDALTAQDKSAHTIRNTKNNLSRLFRLAHAQEVLTLVPDVPITPEPAVLIPRYNIRTKPRRPGYAGIELPYYLHYAQWPPELQQAFNAFRTWATTPYVIGREAQHRKRLSTVIRYRQTFEMYFGYLRNIVQIPPTFEHLFAIDSLTAFVQWHINELHHKPTSSTREFLDNMTVLSREYRSMPELYAQVCALKKTIPIAPKTYNKEDAWVSLETLRAIARTIWPRQKPEYLRTSIDRRAKISRPGSRTAVQAGMSLMFQLWTYRPYRQRNMREMELGRHLRKDDGKWHIAFRDEELKVARKNGHSNVFDLSFPETLVPLLEEYLKEWRPLLQAIAAPGDQHVFLSQYGKPYTDAILRQTTKQIVYRYTGKDFHPHIVRSVWTTEYIRQTNDFYGAAVMLNDTLETVTSTYAHLKEEDVAEKIDRLIDERLGQGK